MKEQEESMHSVKSFIVRLCKHHQSNNQHDPQLTLQFEHQNGEQGIASKSSKLHWSQTKTSPLLAKFTSHNREEECSFVEVTVVEVVFSLKTTLEQSVHGGGDIIERHYNHHPSHPSPFPRHPPTLQHQPLLPAVQKLTPALIIGQWLKYYVRQYIAVLLVLISSTWHTSLYRVLGNWVMSLWD